LQRAFQDHFTKKLSIPTSILIITDGFPDSKSAAIKEIMLASKKLQKKDEISVSLMQIGNDDKCKEFFHKLEKCQTKLQFPNIFVDCLPYTKVENIDQFVNDSLATK